MSLFKRAYARGINDELIRLGHARYPTKLAADEVADAVGDSMNVEPAQGEGVTPETAAEVATTLVDAANKLVEEAGGGMGTAEAPAPEEAALKTSAARDIDTRAAQQAEAVMIKAAHEVKLATGSTIEGGDKGNMMGDSPAGETMMEAKNRPEGIHVLGVGETKHPVGQGNVGTEQVPAAPSDGAPHETPSGDNSVIQQSKLGSVLQGIIQKVAMGTTIEGGDKGNTLGQAAATTGEGKLEADRRPAGYAMTGVGNSDHPAGKGVGVVGAEQPHNDPPSESPAGSLPSGGGGNSVVQHSSAAKEAAEDPFVALFRKTAEEMARHLPVGISEDEKIGHVRQMMGMTDEEKAQYVGLLHKEAGASDDQAVEVTKHAAYCMREHRQRHAGNPNRQDRRRGNQKTAAELTPAQEKLPDALKAAIKAKNGGGDSSDSEGSSESKDKGGEKCSECGKTDCTCPAKTGGLDLLSRIRQVSQSARA